MVSKVHEPRRKTLHICCRQKRHPRQPVRCQSEFHLGSRIQLSTRDPPGAHFQVYRSCNQNSLITTAKKNQYTMIMFSIPIRRFTVHLIGLFSSFLIHFRQEWTQLYATISYRFLLQAAAPFFPATKTCHLFCPPSAWTG